MDSYSNTEPQANKHGAGIKQQLRASDLRREQNAKHHPSIFLPEADH